MLKIFLLISCLVLLCAKSGFAVDVFNAYMSDDSQLGSGTFVDRGINPEYTLSENPLLFVHSPGDITLIQASFWSTPSSTVYFGGLKWHQDDDYAFLPDWTAVPKAQGDWQAKVLYFGDDFQVHNSEHSFSFGPEPISTLLFLCGGAAIGVVRHSRGKRRT